MRNISCILAGLSLIAALVLGAVAYDMNSKINELRQDMVSAVAAIAVANQRATEAVQKNADNIGNINSRMNRLIDLVK